MEKRTQQVRSDALSHRGLVRTNNEDRVQVAVLKPADGKTAFVAVLADGVGGHHAGEVASRIAVDTIITEITRTHPAPDVHFQLQKAFQAANQAILDNISTHPQRAGMGTTGVCALIIGHTIYTAHLGDSRLYLHRGHSLQRLTRDHTMLEELITLAGTEELDNARSQPIAHVLTRYLGAPHIADVDHHMYVNQEKIDKLKLHAEDILLLCSDGITDMLSDEEIANILSTCSGKKRAQLLVYRALENGGHDNASVIVLQIP